MSVDVHNHVMPTGTPDLLRSAPSYGVTIDNANDWSDAHHAPFPVTQSLDDPAAKLA